MSRKMRLIVLFAPIGNLVSFPNTYLYSHITFFFFLRRNIFYKMRNHPFDVFKTRTMNKRTILSLNRNTDEDKCSGSHGCTMHINEHTIVSKDIRHQVERCNRFMRSALLVRTPRYEPIETQNCRPHAWWEWVTFFCLFFEQIIRLTIFPGICIKCCHRNRNLMGKVEFIAS